MSVAPIRPRRSMLYLPASNERAMDKARDLPGDMLTFDLEDSVAPEKKIAARKRLVARLRDGGYGARELLVRVNGLDTAWGHDDLAAFAGVNLHGILLPKIEDAADVHTAEALLTEGGADPGTAIWCMMEDPRAVLNAAAIASASPRMAGFVMGLNDLGKTLRAHMTPGREAFIASLSQTVLAARAHGLAAIDGVFMDLDDAAGLIETCRQGRMLGFDGSSLIHPKQLAAANEIYAPSTNEVAQAEKIIAAHKAASAKGEAVTLVEGRLVEALHVAQAERLLALAAAIEELN